MRENSTAPRPKLPGRPVHHRLGIKETAWEQKVADERPPLQQAVFNRHRPRAGEHLPDGRLGGFWIVRRGGVFGGPVRREILQVGEPNMDIRGQGTDGLHRVIAPGVPHEGDGHAALPNGFWENVSKVGGVDQVDAFRTLLLQLLKDRPQPLRGDGLAKVLVADGAILAEDAAQRTAGEKYSSRAPASRK